MKSWADQVVQLTGLTGSPDMIWICLGALLSGLVRGFSGFGGAMAFLPFAGSVMPPAWALTSMVVMEIASAPAAIKTVSHARIEELLRLGVGALLFLPIGILVLGVLSEELFRFVVCTLTLVLLAFLVGGIRIRKDLSNRMVYGTGGIGGFLAGCTGLAGPPVILLYLARPLPAQVVRANLFWYLVMTDTMLLAAFGILGMVSIFPIVAGLVAAAVHLSAMVIGGRMFNPSRERIFRLFAYAIIACSATLGLLELT